MPTASVITIGNFDGVHLGHRAIVERARAHADRLKAPGSAGGSATHGTDGSSDVQVVALTFDPHPARILRPDAEPATLTPIARRVALLESLGVDRVVVLESTPDLLGQSPREFIEHIVDEHGAVAVVEGPDFRFGRDRAGDIDLLRTLSQSHGFDVEIVEPVETALNDQLLATVSSSLVRTLLTHGRVADAARCLGRPYDIEGVVTRGEQRGRTIGVPTANLDPAALDGVAVPGNGVYAGRVTLPDGMTHAAAISVGPKPTFNGRQRVVEAHLLDCDADLYDRPIRVKFEKWLRDQQPFPGIDALKAQLARDIDATRAWSGSTVNPISTPA